jgi:phage shock protein E
MAGLVEKIKGGATIVDVRTVDEFNDEHYPNALNIPVDELADRITEFGEKAKSVVVYCATGSRSAYAARVLRSEVYVDVMNAGGLYDMP